MFLKFPGIIWSLFSKNRFQKTNYRKHNLCIKNLRQYQTKYISNYLFLVDFDNLFIFVVMDDVICQIAIIL